MYVVHSWFTQIFQWFLCVMCFFDSLRAACWAKLLAIENMVFSLSDGFLLAMLFSVVTIYIITYSVIDFEYVGVL